jgi:hypothetical protein
MLFVRVPAESTKETYTLRLEDAVGDELGWPTIGDYPWAIIYEDDEGTQWACPGNGDKELTREVVERIAERYINTNMDIFYRDQGDIEGLTRIVEDVS